MDSSVIQPYFCCLSGLSASQAATYAPLFQSAATTIEQRCINGVLDDPENVNAAAYVAAALAFRDYIASCMASEPSFEAGDIRVIQYNGRVQAAERILQDALQNAAHLFKADSLFFERVVS